MTITTHMDTMLPHLPLLWEVHRPSIGGNGATIGDLTTLEDESSVEEIVEAYQELKKAEEEAK
ncbi:MAG TPA: hypothetical protein VMW45_03485 [Dehalococcoidia bacterium]|nr:hypothetical protein [Dehalococcoidia bacterium]